ncbi:unnamed protein product [Allacma fusca]|uniref:Palmitoyltransferase n=1 Tax=Allacma fusca TaxID=39272 RepID=A0A8J2P219_9HEXA|nr:unnamed protein product [Allacma fusca]
MTMTTRHFFISRQGVLLQLPRFWNKVKVSGHIGHHKCLTFLPGFEGNSASKVTGFPQLLTTSIEDMSTKGFTFPKVSTTHKLKLWFLTLFYHSSFSFDYCVDVVVEPVFWFVDHFTKLLGRFFVCLVCVLIFEVTFVAHVLGIPFWWDRSPVFTLILIVIGYWILVNILFNFYQAAAVSPGQPTEMNLLGVYSVTVCKICISPKPPRTHHCSICNRCYLKMDHHCPWVNNCIGHYNHRYFYLTAVYIIIGVFFVMLFGVELAFKHVFLEQDILDFGSSVSQNISTFPGPIQFQPQKSLGNTRLMLRLIFGLSFLDETSGRNSVSKANIMFGYILVTRFAVKAMIYITGFLCIGSFIALGGLAWWHGRLISNGETSIEYHINKNNKRKHGDSYVNLYNVGVKKNWKIFLGLDQPGRSFWRHILLPSRHTPVGNGYEWSNLLKYTMQRSTYSSE